MQESVFKPKYPAKMYLGLFFIFPIETYVLWQLFSGKDKSIETVFIAAFFGLIVALIPFAFIRKIVFSAADFSIKKFLWLTKTIDYTDVVDIGVTMILTRKGNIPIQSMTNSEELRNILNKLIEQGKINKYQIENKVVSQEVVSRKALIPAGIISFFLWGTTFLVWPYENSLFRDFSMVLFFIPTYIVVYKFLKNRAENR
jgi:hypothetical protein